MLKNLQILQNDALRTILRKKREEGNKIFHDSSNIQKIQDRIMGLTIRYFKRAEIYENELIERLVMEYNEIEHDLRTPTIICHTREITWYSQTQGNSAKRFLYLFFMGHIKVIKSLFLFSGFVLIGFWYLNHLENND